jgi:hypothetical protein
VSAKITDYGDDDDPRIVCGKGTYGFGTIGQATPRAQVEQEAWRMVQRAGLTTRANRDDVRFEADGPKLFVSYGLK